MKIHDTGNPIDYTVQRELKSAFDIYDEEIYPDGESIMCSIHDSFHQESDQAHNCIGCNFANYTQLLHSALQTYAEVSYPLEAFSATILYSYLLVERFEEVFKIIKLPDSYRLKHFQVFLKIRRWANFLKHPKAFIMVHHPEYFFENDVTIEKSDFENHILVNQDFVDTYYSGDTNNNKLYSLLTNKKNVYVIFPNLPDLITEFCRAQKKFINIISKNEVFREILDGHTTLRDYFEGNENPEDKHDSP
jgi:hypothetical protein